MYLHGSSTRKIHLCKHILFWWLFKFLTLQWIFNSVISWLKIHWLWAMWQRKHLIKTKPHWLICCIFTSMFQKRAANVCLSGALQFWSAVVTDVRLMQTFPMFTSYVTCESIFWGSEVNLNVSSVLYVCFKILTGGRDCMLDISFIIFLVW